MFLINRTSRLILLIVISLSIVSCTDCSFELVKSIKKNDLTADLEYRVCGSYSGFAVSIYRTSDGKPDYGEGSKDIFQAFIRSGNSYMFDKPPISIKWTNKKTLHIQHTTRNSIEDPNSKLMISKAERKYLGVTIMYDPKPIIWE